MIHYQPCEVTRNEIAMAKLRGFAAGAPVETYVKVKMLTAEIAALMALIHGGDWMMEIDHQRPFVMVVPR